MIGMLEVLLEVIPVPQNDLSRVDQPYPSWLHAILNDNLKFVTNFEFNASLGVILANGTIGTESKDAFEIRLAHMISTLGALQIYSRCNKTMQFGRGFVFDDDFGPWRNCVL